MSPTVIAPGLLQARSQPRPAPRWLRAARLVLVHEGLASVVRRGLRRLWLREGYLVYVRALSAEAVPAVCPGLTMVRLAQAAERRGLVGSSADWGAAQYWESVDPDAECYLGWDGNRLVGVHWVSTTHEINDLVRLLPGDCVIGPCVTAPAYRGRGIYPAMLSHVCGDRARRGSQRAYMVVSVANAASIRGIEKAGFQRSVRVTLRRLLGWQRVRVEWQQVEAS